MQILITGDTAGGVFSFVTELAVGLMHGGHSVTLATFGPEPTQNVDGVRWFHHTSSLEWQENPWTDIQEAARWLQSVVAQERPELLHLNTLCHADLGWSIPVVTTIHSCVLTWWDAVRQPPIPESWNRYREVVQNSLAASTVLATPTVALREALSRHWAIDFSSAWVIPNGRDPKLFYPSTKEPFVMSAGRFWDEAKNVKALEQVSKQLRWPIYLAGETRESMSCRSLGVLSQTYLAHWLARASVFISPAFYEPFGLAILEAGMSGCALVLNDIPSLREVWRDAAVFAKPEHFSAAISEVMSEPSEMQRRAFERAQSFTQSAMVNRYLSLYEQARSDACAS